MFGSLATGAEVGGREARFAAEITAEGGLVFEAQQVSARFRNDLNQHFHEHRDVGFYAAQACLSTKHFSAVVKQETGHTAAYWIHHQVVAEAKMLLHIRHDLTVQAVADLLGFEDQATFSRYFRRETGLSPTDFRTGGQPPKQ